MEKYLHEIKNDIANKKPYEDSGYVIDDVHHKLDEFK